MLDRLFRPKPAKQAGDALYAAAAKQARRPDFYTDRGVADTREGRFELYTLHVILLVDRLKGETGLAGEARQTLFDRYVMGLDDAFRELGVGDLSVAKRVKKLGEAFYGRLKAFETALETLPDQAPLAALMTRTVLEDRPGQGDALAAYVVSARRALSSQSLETLLSGAVTWEVSA
ncbi:MAG: ubiquinol-cytochrome C chaperone family protein [Caulobacter sp.]|nr:ubiquinol-cytochrome C chaperone family protein [Caulobacter sp.]